MMGLFMRVVQKVISPPSTRKIWISSSIFIRSANMLPQQKCSAMALLSGWGLELFEHIPNIKV